MRQKVHHRRTAAASLWRNVGEACVPRSPLVERALAYASPLRWRVYATHHLLAARIARISLSLLNNVSPYSWYTLHIEQGAANREYDVAAPSV